MKRARRCNGSPNDRPATPGATLDPASGRLVLPARSWLVAANGPFPLVRLPHAHPGLFDAPVVWHAVPQPDKAYAFSRPLPDGVTFTLAVNISGEPVSFALPSGKVVSLRPHGFYLGE